MSVVCVPKVAISKPLVAIVIPVYKHSVLVAEAINDALSQITEFDYRVVVVNDGCPYSETHQVCLDFALAYPEQVVYLKRRNGGLSAARNTGINFALKSWPSVEAVYLLDADNRLYPKAIQRSLDTLRNDTSIDWVYPHIDMFGISANYDFSGPYSSLMHTGMNVCEAGSMIRRKVFEAGVRFDESMRLGFEDWEFWLQALDKGFRGRHLPDFGFLYRKRPESMLADSGRDEAEIIAYIRRKHKRLFSTSQLLAFEHEEAPRYAIYLIDRHEFILTSDPCERGRAISIEEFDKIYWQNQHGDLSISFPPFVLFTSLSVLEDLEQAGLVSWALWRLEDGLNQSHFAILSISKDVNSGTISISERQGGEQESVHKNAPLIMMSTALLAKCVADTSDAWLRSLTRDFPDPTIFVCCVRIGGRHNSIQLSKSVLPQLLWRVGELRQSIYSRVEKKNWYWRIQGLKNRGTLYQNTRQSVGGGVAVYPRLKNGARRQIGFILPIAAYGGVEKVTFNVARVLKNHGWVPHLFITEKTEVDVNPQWRELFETINFLCDAKTGSWEDIVGNFMGTALPLWAKQGKHSRAVSLLNWLDVVVNCHSGDLNGIMGQLRRHGVKTVGYLHVIDHTPLGRPVGHPYLTLGYEHGYDLIACCSNKLTEWCSGHGVPADKLVTIPNAAGYALDGETIKSILYERKVDKPRSRLRVLFLGRLDRQKGLEQLLQVVLQSKAENLPIDWRIVGSSIMQDSTVDLSAIKEFCEPPASGVRALTELYQWADVLLLLSAWEGLPLTILEAMRIGVTVLATDVGAVDEVLRHEKNGFLIPLENTSAVCIEQLRQLAEDPDLSQRIGREAAQSVADRSWEKATMIFQEKLTHLIDEPIHGREVNTLVHL